MGITTVLAIYFLIWWITLFAVLPWGVRSQHEAGSEIAPGTDPGAPAIHRMWRTLLWTTVIASMVFAILWAVYASGLIPFDMLAALFTPPHHR